MPHTVEINTTHPATGTAVITLTGPCDVYTAADVRSLLIDLLNEGRRRQVVDLAAVDFVDSSGLGVLVGAAKRARYDGGQLVLAVDLDGRVGKALRVTGLHKGIRCAPSVDAALELLAEPEPPLAPLPSVIAAQILQSVIRDEAGFLHRDRIETRLDALVDSGEIRGLDHDALCALAGAVERELLAAADEDRITVTIAVPTP